MSRLAPQALARHTSVVSLPMAAETEESPFARVALIVVAVLALYVLSIGPAYRYALQNYKTEPVWLINAYFPVLWTADHCKPVEVALNRYVNLWRP